MKTPKPVDMLKEAHDILQKICLAPDKVQQTLAFHTEVQPSTMRRQVERIKLTLEAMETKNVNDF